MNIPTIAGRAYAIACDNDCSVKYLDDEGTQHSLAQVHGGSQTTFVAMTDMAAISDDTAIVTELPKSAPIGSAVGGGSTELRQLKSGTKLTNGGIYSLKQSELPAVGTKASVRLQTAAENVAYSGCVIIGDDVYISKDGDDVDGWVDDAIWQGSGFHARFEDDEKTTLIIEADAYGESANGLSVSWQPGPYAIEGTLSGGSLTHAAGTYADLSALTIGSAVTTAEIWIDCDGATLPEIYLPGWTQLDENTMQLGKRNIIVVRNEGAGIYYSLNPYVHSL